MKYLPTYDKCFVCGKNNPRGLGLRFYMDGEVAKVEFTPSEAHMGYKGVVHGGVLYSLIDETMGWAPAYLKKRYCVSAEITIRYIQSAPIEKKMIVSGFMTRDRGKVWETEGEIRDEEGTLYARAKGKYMPLSKEESQEVDGYLTYEGVERIIQPDGSILGEIRQATAQATDTQAACDRAVSILKERVGRYNWVGVYVLQDDVLALKTYRGRPTPHTRIPIDKGVCGAAAREGKTIIVPDVNDDPRYLVCSVETKSEIVAPIYKDGRVVAEIDIDSDELNAFGEDDQKLLESVADSLGDRLDFHSL